MPELFANNAVTTLSAPATALQTSLTVTSNDGFPSVTTASTNFFYATIGTEIVKVTNNPTTIWTVERGNQSTVAAVRAAGEVVYCVVTKQTMIDILAAASSVTSFGTYAALPVSGSTGALYFTTDSPYTFRWSGSVWQPFVNDKPVSIPPNVSTLTWINQGSSTAVTTNGVLRATFPTSGTTNVRGLVKSYTAPRSLEIGFYSNTNLIGAQIYGILTRALAGAPLTVQGLDIRSNQVYFRGRNYNSSTSFNAELALSTGAFGVTSPLYIRFTDDNTNKTFSASFDGGASYTQLTSLVRTSFLTPDQFGIGTELFGISIEMSMNIFHWREF